MFPKPSLFGFPNTHEEKYHWHHKSIKLSLINIIMPSLPSLNMPLLLATVWM